MNKSIFLVTALMVISTSTSRGLRAASEQRNAMQAFMREKVGYSSNILEGIALEKPDQVATNALLLRDMTQTNAFLVLGNSDYLRAVKKFQGNIDALVQAAKNKDLTQASLLLAKVNRSCVECHKTFRREQHTAGDKR